MSILYANGSVTHTYGNVACLAMDYITKYFDEDFFKVKHISTKLAYRQLDVFRTNVEFWKLHKPFLLIRPRIEMDDSSKYFYGSAAMNRINNVQSPMEYANTVELLKDRANGNMIRFLWNRSKIYYDVVMMFDTINQQLNTANFLMNLLVPNTPFMVPTSLESYIPKHVVYAIADHQKIPRENTAEILHYLNTEGNVPFTYKLKNGSGNDEFFALYNTNVEMIASDLSIDDGNMKGMVAHDFTISFTLSCEFNMMGCYYLFLLDNDDRFHMCPHEDIDVKETRVNLFTIPLMYDLDIPSGWKILSAPSFFVNGDEDEVNLMSIIDDNTSRTIFEYQQAMHLDLSTFVNFRVFRGRTELKYWDDFVVDTSDVSNITLHIRNCDGRETYRLFFIVNMSYIHSIAAEMDEFNKEK